MSTSLLAQLEEVKERERVGFERGVGKGDLLCYLLCDLCF